MSAVSILFVACGLTVFILGLQTVVFVPLALYYEWWKKRTLARLKGGALPFVSVIVPAYNEENTIGLSIRSILRSDYPSFEVIVVNDGSTDRTQDQLRPLLDAGKIIYVHKDNGGKASALNAGIVRARGEVVLYTDADSFFRPDTIRNMARWFADSRVDAVCGNDTPIRPENAQQKLLTITTHIGSGFVRRALSVLNVLPIISGNLGAVRVARLRQVGGFSNLWGEDLDLTFKLHAVGARIVFDPGAIVECDVPATVASLWKQRIRWMRSFLKNCRIHRGLFFSPKHAPFSLYLPFNWLSMVVVPLLQVVALFLLPVAITNGLYDSAGIFEIISYLGFILFFMLAVFSTMLDRSWRHLSYIPVYGWLIVPFSYFYNAVLLASLYLERTRSEETWGLQNRRRVDATPVSRRFNRGRVAVALSVLAVAGAGIILTRISATERTTAHRTSVVSVTVATHFDAWEDPARAVASLVENPRAVGLMNVVGVGAGRAEWNNFRWEGHPETWSNDQRSSASDLLEDAVNTFHRSGKGVVAIIDFYAPQFVNAHKDLAAIAADGTRSQEQICFIELVNGEYGRQIVAMATYLARHYEIEAIGLTELEYNRYCYDDRCLASFRSSTGQNDWPRRFLTSTVDRDDPAVGQWKSALMATFLKQIADSVHKYGKRLYVDVPVHLDELSTEGMASGLHYPYLLKFTDALVVWDYFYLDGRPAESSEDVARFFTTRYGSDRVVISIGLWGKKKPVRADGLAIAVQSSLNGGATALWITPSHLMTPAHWDSLHIALGFKQASGSGVP